MSLFDKFLDVMRLNGEDDYDDDYDFANEEYYDDEELHISGEGRLFYEVKSFNEIIKVVKNLKRIDVDKLDGIVEWFDELLHKYQQSFLLFYMDVYSIVENVRNYLFDLPLQLYT